jgi:hypothetical protein
MILKKKIFLEKMNEKIERKKKNDLKKFQLIEKMIKEELVNE